MFPAGVIAGVPGEVGPELNVEATTVMSHPCNCGCHEPVKVVPKRAHVLVKRTHYGTP